MNNINNPDNPVILFIPETGIYPFIRGLSVLGDALMKKGGKVLITHDTGQMLRSPLLAKNRTPLNISPDKKIDLYKTNEKYFKIATKKYNFSSIELSEIVNQKMMQEIDSLGSETNYGLDNIKFRGFPVGKIAQYDFILETKFPYSTELSKEHRLLYLTYVKNTALTIAITDRICEIYDPSLFLTFNEYAQCQAVRYSAKTHNVSRLAMTYPVHFNIDGSRFSIWESTCEYWRYRHCQKWNEGKDFPIKPEHVIACWNDAVFRIHKSGSHIFSHQNKTNPSVIFERLGLNPNRKTIVAYTSSQDERGSVEIAMKIWKEDNNVTDAFANQIEWLNMLNDYASKNSDIQIVVRIHPREGQRQFGFDSKNLEQLKGKLKDKGDNFIIVWPDDPMSSYDLLELANVCLVAWSFMGQEAVRLGIPVLSFTGNMFYPDDDFIQVATTREEYKKKLDFIVNMEYSWLHLVKAVRFYHWRIFITSLDLSETVPVSFKDDTVWPEAPSSMVETINDILSGNQDLIRYNMEKWRSSINPDSVRYEYEAMRQGIRLFLDKIFYPPLTHKERTGALFHIYKRLKGELVKNLSRLTKKKLYSTKAPYLPFTDYNLEYATNTLRMEEFIQRTREDKKLRIIVADGPYAVLINNGKLLRRMSPLAIRLAKLHEYKF